MAPAYLNAMIQLYSPSRPLCYSDERLSSLSSLQQEIADETFCVHGVPVVACLVLSVPVTALVYLKSSPFKLSSVQLVNLLEAYSHSLGICYNNNYYIILLIVT